MMKPIWPKKMLKIKKKKLVSLWDESSQKKIEYRDVNLKTDQKIAELKQQFETCCRTLRREWYGTTLCAVIFFRWFWSSQMPRINLCRVFLPLIPNFTRIIGFLCPRRKIFIWYRALLALVISPLFRERQKKQILLRLETLAGHPSFDFFQWFLSQPLGWAGSSPLWFSLPLVPVWQ